MKSRFAYTEITELLRPEEAQVIGAYSPGYARKPKLGKRPAVAAIDFTYSFVGIDAPIAESVKKWPKSAGEFAWKAVRSAKKVIEAARSANVPVYYTIASGELRSSAGFGSKTRREANDFGAITVVEELKPQSGDRLVRKTYPSGFFGTNMISLLVRDHVDTLIVMGGTTSGCVRATVVDASSYHLNVLVVSDAVFDRIQISQAVNLFDMKLKYADIISSRNIIKYLRSFKSPTNGGN